MDSPLGLESGTVVVVPYDHRWPDLFLQEAARIRSTISPLEILLEHTGSTAVPGLAAKPVLDILAGYQEATALPDVIRALERAGYQHRGQDELPEHEFFRRGEPRSYHLHLTRIGSTFWTDHLTFRDRLRADSSLRDEYAALKLELATRYPRNRESYTDSKTAFVRRVLR